MATEFDFYVSDESSRELVRRLRGEVEFGVPPETVCVDGLGKTLQYPDGRDIDGERVGALVGRSGMRLTNAGAAQVIIEADAFADDVCRALIKLNQSDTRVS